jgi:hypothetical protein
VAAKAPLGEIDGFADREAMPLQGIAYDRVRGLLVARVPLVGPVAVPQFPRDEGEPQRGSDDQPPEHD